MIKLLIHNHNFDSFPFYNLIAGLGKHTVIKKIDGLLMKLDNSILLRFPFIRNFAWFTAIVGKGKILNNLQLGHQDEYQEGKEFIDSNNIF